MHLPKHHSAGTLARYSCLTIKDFAVQAEMVAVETSIDVGNILWIFYDCLSHCNTTELRNVSDRERQCQQVVKKQNIEPMLGVIRESEECPLKHKRARSKCQNSQASREHENYNQGAGSTFSVS